MTDEILKRDQNRVTVMAGVGNDSDQDILMLRSNPITKKLLVETVLTNSSGTLINPATETKQDSQIVLETALNTLITTLNNTVTTNDKTHLLLQQIRDAIAMPVDYNEASNSKNINGAVTISSGTITTLSNQTNIGGFSADMMTENTSFQDWGLSIRSLII